LHCEASENPHLPPARGWEYCSTIGSIFLEIGTRSATPWASSTIKYSALSAAVDMYIGSTPEGYSSYYGQCGSAQTGICGQTYYEGNCNTRYVETKAMTADADLEFSALGDCSSMPDRDVGCPQSILYDNGGWTCHGPYFVIKYETGLDYQ
jgi:hypothetical protein